MSYEIHTSTGKILRLNMTPDSTVRNLQEKIEDTEGISQDSQYIFAERRILGSEERLCDIGMRELNLLSKVRAGMSVELNDIDGRKLIFEIGMDTTVNQLKRLIEEKNGLPPENQRLVMSHGHGISEIMYDNRKVADYIWNDVERINAMSLLIRSQTQDLEPLEIEEERQPPKSIFSSICPCCSIL